MKNVLAIVFFALVMTYGVIVVKDEIRLREAVAEQQKNARRHSTDPSYYGAMEHFSRHKKSDINEPK